MAEMAPGPGENEIAQEAAKKASQVENDMMGREEVLGCTRWRLSDTGWVLAVSRLFTEQCGAWARRPVLLRGLVRPGRRRAGIARGGVGVPGLGVRPPRTAPDEIGRAA